MNIEYGSWFYYQQDAMEIFVSFQWEPSTMHTVLGSQQYPGTTAFPSRTDSN